MVSACTDALSARGRCALADSLAESVQPQAVALVLWQDPQMLQVTIRVGQGGGQWTVRSVTFSDGDSLIDRWTTVGLTVATLVVDKRGNEAEPPAPPPPPRPTPVAAKAVAHGATATPAREAEAAGGVSTNPRPRVFGVGALVGPGWDRGGARVGGWVTVGFQLRRLPIVLYALGSYAAAKGPTINDVEVSSRWLTGGAGAGLVGTWQALRLSGRAGVELTYRRAIVEYEGRGLSDAELPLNLHISGSYPAGGLMAATLGAAMRLPPGGSGETDGYLLRSPRFGLELLAGLELRL